MKHFLETEDCGSYVRAVVPSGANVEDAVQWALDMANGNKPIRFEFNGTPIEVRAGMARNEILSRWSKDRPRTITPADRLSAECERLRKQVAEIDRLDAAEAEAVADCPGLAWLEEHGWAELRRRCGGSRPGTRLAISCAIRALDECRSDDDVQVELARIDRNNGGEHGNG